VSKTIPSATRIAWAERERDITDAQPGVTRKRFVYLMSRSSYEKEWGTQYDRPTIRDRMAAVLVKLIPPVGPLRTLRFRMPTPEVEKLFMQSFDRSMREYNVQLDQVRTKSLEIANINYDLGEIAKPGVYGLQDKTYAFWLQLLAAKQYKTVTPAIRNELIGYFRSGLPPPSTFDSKTNVRIGTELEGLKALTSSNGLVTRQSKGNNVDQ
jgi:hypothetical protein